MINASLSRDLGLV